MSLPRRRACRAVKAGRLLIGGQAEISVQSMTTTETANVEATVAQIKQLEAVGCQLVRVSVPNTESAEAISKIKQQISIPICADVHFDYRLALASIKAGADKIRLNPGNIGNKRRVKEIAAAARDAGIPIRVGSNAGSIDRKKYGTPTAKSLADSAIEQATILEEAGFEDIVLSMKAFDVPMMIEAYQIAAENTEYPLHLGVTEAGLPWEGTIRSSVGIGALLAQGIGDTFRVSLTGDPVEEIRVGLQILASLNLYKPAYTMISCPTCGRCCINLEAVAVEIDSRLRRMQLKRPIKVAVMGCSVNGPGEASMADVGLAGGVGFGLIFAQGKVLRRVPESDLVDELIREVEKFENDS